jgi:predicted Zn-dependent peptidase
VSVVVSRLANGLTVVSHARPDVETVSLGLWIGAGSRSESLAEHGVAHFLEHMAFKGTDRRSAQAIAEEIEAVGGELNAATGVDSTAYYARVLRQDFGLALDILSDIILAPRFDRTEFSRERDVILQEIASAQDSPEDMVFDLAQTTAFPDQPAGRPILGTVESVKGFKSTHLKSYLSTHYHAPNMVLAAAGAVDHERLLAQAEAMLAPLNSGTAPEPVPALYRGGVARNEKSFEQTHLVLAFEAPPYRHADYFAAQVCAGALGGGMSSRLFQEVRERRGLCYAIHAFASGLSDTGMLAIYAACGPDRAAELLAVLRDELRRAAESGFSGEEVGRVKAQLKMGLLAGLESSGARAEQLARQILIHRRPLTTQELIEKVEAVTQADVQRMAGDLLASSVSLATVGPILHVARFDSLAAKFTHVSSEAA